MEMDNKNVIIALVLMLVVWFGFSLLFPQQELPVPAGQEPPATVSQAQTADSPTPPVEVEPAPSPPAEKITEADLSSRELTIETSKYTAVLSSSGARLVSFHLKDYGLTADPESERVQMTQPGPLAFANWRTTGSESFGLAGNAPYTLSVKQDHLLVESGESTSVLFSTTTDTGLQVNKTFTFYGDQYKIDLQVQAINTESSPLRGVFQLALVQRWSEDQVGDRYSFVGPVTLVGEDLEEDAVDKLDKEPKTYAKDAVWTSFTTKYFMGAAVPLAGAAERIRIEKPGEAVENLMASPYLTIPAGQSINLEFLLFMGPKVDKILKALDHQLDRAIDFGFFSVIAKPLDVVLQFFYGLVGNYGVAIILLTVIIKMLFWPLTNKSYKSMKSMQKLQPEMTKIREKFKNDKERMNQELMGLYKTHRVNPLGGCLPMLVQIPVFFALYKVLLDTIDLRHAPFAFWLTDLSAKDPYYITPVIMGVTMFIQQKMTPSTMDPTQAKLFMLMPVVFTFLFLNFPSGLVIYWLVNNLLTIGQQYLINRKA